MTIEEMLENRHATFLEWVEPWPACGPEGNELHADVVLSASVHHCINMRRLAEKQAGRPTVGNDKEFLLDFIAINWARAKEKA